MRNEYKEKITSTADWQINRLKIPGYSSEDIENALKDTLNASYLEMFELYDKVIDWEYVRNKDIYEQINAEYIPFEENKHLIQVTSAIKKQSLEDLENITRSLGFYLDYGGRKVLTPLSQVYSRYLDNACMDIVTVWSQQQLYDVCGLGTVTGLCGANCYHTYFPFVPGVSVRTYTDDWLDEQNWKESEPTEFRGKEYTLYEAKQRQRQMETAMRAQREKVQMLQDGDADPDDVMLAKCKYQGQLDEYARFSKQMGLKQERERIYIDGRWRVVPGRIDKKLNVVNTMKISVPRDAYKIKGMTSEAKHEIEAAINNLKKEYDIRLDLIEVAKMEVGDIFGAAPYLDDRGKLRFALVINEDIDYNVVKKKIQRRYDKGRFAGKSIEDYIAHEMAHIMTYQDCKNEAEFRTRQRIVERQFMQGISQYADKTGKGEESLAEAFVRYRNKEKIPIRAELLIRSYIERWKK